MKNRRTIIALIVLAMSYALGPFLAGAFSVGDRLGPAVYPQSFHEVIYIMAHEAFQNEKPREPIDTWMYHRPLFYGSSRRLKSQPEREAYIELARQNKSPALDRLIQMNEEANKSLHATAAAPGN